MNGPNLRVAPPTRPRQNLKVMPRLTQMQGDAGSPIVLGQASPLSAS